MVLNNLYQSLLTYYLLLPTYSITTFTDQPNLVVHCGVHLTFQPNFNSQIVGCKLNLKIEYLPPDERLVCVTEKQIRKT